jgi:hypothetical protein
MKKIDYIEISGLAAQSETTKICFKINKLIEVLNELVEKQEPKAECVHALRSLDISIGVGRRVHCFNCCPDCGVRL